MTEAARPLEGLRVVDCTIERGELTRPLPRRPRRRGGEGRAAGRVAGPPARPGPLGRVARLGGAQRREAAAWCSTSTPTPTASGSTRCSTTPTCSSRPSGVRLGADGGRRRPRRVAARVIRISSPSPSPRSASTARSPDYVATDGARCRRPAASRSRPACPTGTPLFPPGHLVDDLVSVTAAFAALCALYQREQTGAGQFVELSANEAVALCADWALPNVSARVLAGEPPAEVRSGSGPVYPCSSARTATCGWWC